MNAQMRLHALGQNTAENIAPGIVGRRLDAGCRRGPQQAALYHLCRRGWLQQIEAGMALERLRPVTRSGSANGSMVLPPKRKVLGAGGTRRFNYERGTVVHQRLVGLC